MSVTNIANAIGGVFTAPSANSVRAGQYVNPTGVQKMLKLFDGLCAFATLTGLFFYSLRFMSYEAALVTAAVIAAEATYVYFYGMRWIRIYDIDILARPLRGALAALSLLTLIGATILWLINVTLFSVYINGILTWIIVNAAHIMTSRTIVGMWAQPLAAKGAFKRRIAIVGGGDEAAKAITALDESPDIDVQILGMYDDRTDDRSPPVVCGYRKLGNLAKLAEDARRGEIDLIIMAIPMTAHVRLMQLLPKLWALPVEVRVCGQAIDMKLSPSAYGYLGKLPLLNVFSRHLTQGNPVLKEIFERTLAISLLIALSPLLCTIALLIAVTSPGPILVREEHRSFDGSPLDLFRFRTTRQSNNGQSQEPTSIGRVLERLNLTRLPYLLSIIAGDIAFVGPAPHDNLVQGDVGHYQRVANAYCLRHDIKPGLTGWAQIHGMRHDSDSPEALENRVKYDLEYVDRTSTWFDLKILLKTPFAWIRYERPAYSI